MADRSTGFIGRESTVVPGRFGEPLEVREAVFSAEHARKATSHPLLLCLHGWGSNERDFAAMMRYIAPHNDAVSLRAPLTLQAPSASGFAAGPGAYSWFHDSVPIGGDLDRDAYAAASAIDAWVSANVSKDRDVVPIGFSQGGMLAVHLLRVHPERYRAAISLSGFLAPGQVEGTAPADSRLVDLHRPVFYGYGNNDTVIAKPEIHAMLAWLEEHTWLTQKAYHGMDHSVNLEEFGDIRQWLLLHDIASGVL